MQATGSSSTSTRPPSARTGSSKSAGSSRHEGRAAIVERVGGATGAQVARNAVAAAKCPSDGASAGPPKRIVRHNVTNIRFESVTRDEAVVASYFTVFTEIGLDHMGRYRDRLVPVDDRWLIAHRFVSTDWRSPDTTFGAGSASPSPS